MSAHMGVSESSLTFDIAASWLDLRSLFVIRGLSPLHDLVRLSGTSSNSHSVAARNGCTNIPRAAGSGSGGRDHSNGRLLKPTASSVRPPGSTGTDQIPGDCGLGLSALVRL